LHQDQEDKEAIAKIGAIIQREQQCNFLEKTTLYVTGKKKTQRVTQIHVEGEGGAIFVHTN
jgi:hypothetical protein